MDDCKLTIIMSNYNQEKYISKALDSVLKQKVTFKYKLIIVDDHSTKDNSVQIIKNFVAAHDNFEAILASENKGYLANILRAKKITKTKYFCLLDADDYWTDIYWLQKAYDFLEKNEGYVIYESNVHLLIDDKIKDSFISKKINSGTFDKEDMFKFKNIPITQTTGMFFRNVIFSKGIPTVMEESVGTLSERSFEGDTGRFIMHLKYGKAYYSKELVGVYRITPNGIWVRLRRSQKLLITARCYLDYYRFYNESISFFATKCWEFLVQYYDEKKNELRKLHDMDVGGNDDEKNLETVYGFCYNNRQKVVRDKRLVAKLRECIRSVKHILRE